MVLAEPKVEAVVLPAEITAVLNKNLNGAAQEFPGAVPTLRSSPPAAPPPVKATLEEDIALYLSHVTEENVPHHLKNKISQLRRLFGYGMEPKELEASRSAAKRQAEKIRAGELAEDAMLQYPMEFATASDVDMLQIRRWMSARFRKGKTTKCFSKKTKRHYREMLHQFFEFLIKNGRYIPTNPHAPNPISTLPTWLEKKGERRIIFLKKPQLEHQYEVLEASPSLLAAVKIMAEAGVRRGEALGLTIDDIAIDLSYLGVTNSCAQDDAEDFLLDEDERHHLKTGPRTVTILPELKSFLTEYLPTLTTSVIIPSPKGLPWDRDNFSAALRRKNKSEGLIWSSGHYRHTYATHRAAEGWGAMDLAREMGTSVAMIERHYAGYLKPNYLHRRAP